jgi:hypothetical protein
VAARGLPGARPIVDRIIDEVGQEKSHPLASLMDVLGVLRQKIRDGEGAVASTRGACAPRIAEKISRP